MSPNRAVATLVWTIALALAIPFACTVDVADVEAEPPDASAGAAGTGGLGGSGGANTGGTGGLGTGGGTGGQGGTGAQGGSSGAGGLGPFGTPKLVQELSDPADDDDPTLTADFTEIYFNSDRGGDFAIWTASRATPSSPWGPVSAVAATDGPDLETNPAVAPDGLSLWFASDRGTARNIYLSTRPNRSSAWGSPVRVDELSSSATDHPGAVSQDGLTFVLSSNRDGSDSDIHVSMRSSKSDPWGAPTPLAELNTTAPEGGVWLSPDGLTAYFDSGREGPQGDLFWSSRASRTGPFDLPVAVAELNTPVEETDAWLSPDLRTIMFTRGPSPRDIYEASR